MKFTKDKIPFTQVANEVLKNNGLSWKAKGLYAYIFSKPDDWDFSSNRMINESLDGKAATIAALRELEKAGYLQRKKLSTGRMEYILKHSSLSAETELRQEPKSGFPTQRKPQSAETEPISNKEGTSNKEIAGASPAGPFIWKEYLDKLFASPRDDLNVIALYFEEKKLKFDNREEASAAISRHLRAAKQVAKFGDEKILKAIKKTKDEYPAFTIETILKVLTR